MSAVWRTILVTALVAFLAGALGVYAGNALFAGPRAHDSLDVAVHRQLDLSAEQKRQLEVIEDRYAERKHDCESRMRAATRAIAAAIAEDGAYTPQVERAVDRFHEAMGELQHATILHVFEMRAVLTPDQQAKFDRIVQQELLRSSAEPE